MAGATRKFTVATFLTVAQNGAMRRMQIFALLSALAVAESYTLPRAVQRVRAPAQTARHPDATPEEYEIVYGEGACVGAGIDERLYAINENLINVVKGCVDLAYEGRDYARFYVLEVLARVPQAAARSDEAGYRINSRRRLTTRLRVEWSTEARRIDAAGRERRAAVERADGSTPPVF